MSKPMLNRLPLFMALCFLLSLPAVVVAFDEDQSASASRITQTSFGTDETSLPPFKVFPTPPSWQTIAADQCIDSCMEEVMTCLAGKGNTPEDVEQCDKELTECLSKCNQNPNQQLTLLQLLKNK